MIQFHCHKCNKKIGVLELYAGCRAGCPRCSAHIRIPRINDGETRMGSAKENTQYSLKVYNAMGNGEEIYLFL